MEQLCVCCKSPYVIIGYNYHNLCVTCYNNYHDQKILGIYKACTHHIAPLTTNMIN